MCLFLPCFQIGFVELDGPEVWSHTVRCVEKLVINIFEHFLQWKVCCAFHGTAQMFSFSQLAPSHCARIKTKFQGRLHRLLFSGFFACLRWINFYHFEKLLKVHWPVYLINQCIKPKEYVFFYLLTLFLLSGPGPPLFFLSVWPLRIYLMHRGSRICISENFREILCR